MVLPQGGSTFVSGGEYSPPPTGWLDKPLLPGMAALNRWTATDKR